MGDILLELIDEQLEKDKYEQRVIKGTDQET